jgi:hypothetical protein
MITLIIGTKACSLASGVPVASSVVPPFCRCQYKNFIQQNGMPRRTSEQMLMRRILLFALLAYATGSLLVYLFGDSGVSAFDRLAEYRDRLDQNVRNLDGLNRTLQAELASVRDDPRRTVVLAREGASAPAEPYQVGSLLRLKSLRRDRGPWLKTAGLGVAALAGLLTFLLGRRGRRSLHGARRR